MHPVLKAEGLSHGQAEDKTGFEKYGSVIYKLKIKESPVAIKTAFNLVLVSITNNQFSE